MASRMSRHVLKRSTAEFDQEDVLEGNIDWAIKIYEFASRIRFVAFYSLSASTSVGWKKQEVGDPGTEICAS